MGVGGSLQTRRLSHILGCCQGGLPLSSLSHPLRDPGKSHHGYLGEIHFQHHRNLESQKRLSDSWIWTGFNSLGPSHCPQPPGSQAPSPISSHILHILLGAGGANTSSALDDFETVIGIRSLERGVKKLSAKGVGETAQSS